MNKRVYKALRKVASITKEAGPRANAVRAAWAKVGPNAKNMSDTLESIARTLDNARAYNDPINRTYLDLYRNRGQKIDAGALQKLRSLIGPTPGDAVVTPSPAMRNNLQLLFDKVGRQRLGEANQLMQLRVNEMPAGPDKVLALLNMNKRSYNPTSWREVAKALLNPEKYGGTINLSGSFDASKLGASRAMQKMFPNIPASARPAVSVNSVPATGIPKQEFFEALTGKKK